MRDDFMTALDELIEDFARDPGISDDELVETLEAKASAIRQVIRQLQGEPVS